MSDLGTSLPQGIVRANELTKRANAVLWVFTFLAPCFVPIPIAAFVLRQFSGDRHWPPFSELFGGGDVAIIVIAVLGSIIGEVAYFDRRKFLPAKVCLLVVSAVVSLLAVVIYALAKYSLAGPVGEAQQKDLYLYGVSSLVGVGIMATIQVLLLAWRK